MSPASSLNRDYLIALAERLDKAYGPHRLVPTGDPVSELVLMMLSQATSDKNRDQAFAALRAAFPQWAAVREAEPAAIAAAIRSGGLAQRKAPRIREILRAIAASPDPDLAELATLPVSEGYARLTALPGVGPKTAACVMLFAAGRPAFPVDTHIHRIARRLGLVGPKIGAVETQRLLEAILPADPQFLNSLHLNLLAHGRQVCLAGRPRCGRCFLAAAAECPSAAPTAGPGRTKEEAANDEDDRTRE